MMLSRTLYLAFAFNCLISWVISQDIDGIQFIKKYQTAHLLEAGKTEITLTGGAVNSAIDIFNFKEKIASSENLDISQFSDFGDWQSYEALINIGFSKRITGRLIYGFDLLEIGRSEADVQHYGIEMKALLVREKEIMPAISLSFKFDTHIANNIRGDIRALSFSLGDIDITKEFNPPESLTVGGLNDQNIHLGIHFGKIYSDKFMLYSFHKYINTNVSSEFATSLEIGQFQKLQNDFSYNANSYNGGFGAYYHFNDAWLITGEYNLFLFSRKFKGSSFAGENENIAHTVDIALHYFINESWAISLGGMVDSSFLAGEMPLTFNKKSATKFDNPYGQLYLSLTYGFDIGK